jgi:hypothetical protein
MVGCLAMASAILARLPQRRALSGVWVAVGLLAGAFVSPASAAPQACKGAALVVIGGGEVARDELLAARPAGKPVTFLQVG